MSDTKKLAYGKIPILKETLTQKPWYDLINKIILILKDSLITNFSIY